MGGREAICGAKIRAIDIYVAAEYLGTAVELRSAHFRGLISTGDA